MELWPRLRLAGVALSTSVAAGDTIHLALHELGLPLPHHLYHVLLVAGAATVFWGWAALHIRRHGRPRFSLAL